MKIGKFELIEAIIYYLLQDDENFHSGKLIQIIVLVYETSVITMDTLFWLTGITFHGHDEFALQRGLPARRQRRRWLQRQVEQTQ